MTNRKKRKQKLIPAKSVGTHLTAMECIVCHDIVYWGTDSKLPPACGEHKYEEVFEVFEPILTENNMNELSDEYIEKIAAGVVYVTMQEEEKLAQEVKERRALSVLGEAATTEKSVGEQAIEAIRAAMQIEVLWVIPEQPKDSPVDFRDEAAAVWSMREKFVFVLRRADRIDAISS